MLTPVVRVTFVTLLFLAPAIVDESSAQAQSDHRSQLAVALQKQDLALVRRIVDESREKLGDQALKWIAVSTVPELASDKSVCMWQRLPDVVSRPHGVAEWAYRGTSF